MNELVAALKSYIILSLNDLYRIKKTLTERYAHMSPLERADLLALAVHNHLNKHLAGIDETRHDALKNAILSATLAKHVYTITRFDIFEAIFELDVSESSRVEIAESWLAESVKNPVPRWALEDYMNRAPLRSASLRSDLPNRTENDLIKPFPAHPSRERISLRRIFIEWFEHINYESFNRYIARNLVLILMVVLLALTTGTIASLVIKPDPHVILKGDINYKDYLGLAALDRVYLITGIHGESDDTSIKLSLRKQTFDFGLQTPLRAFKYKTIHYFEVRHYILTARNGLIGQSSHFNQIIHSAFINDIDPLLLLAIIGQEQAFIPKDGHNASEIINNPYNVYHSWLIYNTTLRDSTQIAINTIKNRLRTVPPDVSPFQWLNTVYAEDENWHQGVRLIYVHLQSL